MFGFLYAPSVKCGSAIHSEYRSLFCGLSCQLHNDYNAVARFLVNRDSTFLALVGASIAGNPCCSTSRTCCNPLTSPRDIVTDDLSLQYSAAVTVSGLATKLQDNIEDESGLKSLLPKIGSKLIESSTDTAIGTLNSLGFPTLKVQQSLATQSEIEASSPDFIAASQPTATAYGAIFSHLSTLHHSPQYATPLQQLGASLGRLIYWRDAVDDWEDDQKKGRFNPLCHNPPETLPSLIQQATSQLLASIQAIPWKRNETMITSIIDHSIQHHQDLTQTPKKQKKRNIKKNKDNNNCCDHCDCYDCCDCSSCKSSCCDFDCCPCDC